MYTILVQDDNTLYTSIRENILQGSKNIDYLSFLVKTMYNDIDMTNSTVVLTYILPISKERKTKTLVKSEELYKDRLEYKILLNEEFTTEVGEIKVMLTFMVDNDILRKTTYSTVTIHPVEETENSSSGTNTPAVIDDLYLDRDTNSIYLTSNGVAIGHSISINDIGNAVVDTSDTGLVTVITE